MKAQAFFVPIAALMSALILYAAAEAQPHRLSGKPRTVEGKLRLARRQVSHDRRALAAVSTRHWTLLSPVPWEGLLHRSWLRRDRAYVRELERALVPSWLWRAFLCIHYNPRTGHGEGAWNDPNPPYFGGLQMDLGFQRTYGRHLLETKGTADHWTPAEQIGVAIRAYRTRGFWPWPNTAKACGLL